MRDTDTHPLSEDELFDLGCAVWDHVRASVIVFGDLGPIVTFEDDRFSITFGPSMAINAKTISGLRWDADSAGRVEHPVPSSGHAVSTDPTRNAKQPDPTSSEDAGPSRHEESTDAD